MTSVRTLSFVLCSLVAALASAGASATAGPSQPTPADPKALLRKVNSYCPGGIEHILPGEYYFCAAARDFGNGHNDRARERLRDAAHWASKSAQYVLGLMYFNGDEGPANRPLGVAWLALASERHDPRFEPAFAKAYLELSSGERAQADAYWLQLREEYGDKVAGRRAHRRYLAEVRNILAAAMFGGSIFMDGLTPPTGDGAGTFADGTSGRLGGQSGFSMERLIVHDGDEFFRGLEGTVEVGEPEMTLVPIGQVATRSVPAGQ
jgi:hypothetical protein